MSVVPWWPGFPANITVGDIFINRQGKNDQIMAQQLWGMMTGDCNQVMADLLLDSQCR